MSVRVWKPAPGVLEILGALPDGVRGLAEYCMQYADGETWVALLAAYPQYELLLVRAADLQGACARRLDPIEAAFRVLREQGLPIPDKEDRA